MLITCDLSLMNIIMFRCGAAGRCLHGRRGSVWSMVPDQFIDKHRCTRHRAIQVRNLYHSFTVAKYSRLTNGASALLGCVFESFIIVD